MKTRLVWHSSKAQALWHRFSSGLNSVKRDTAKSQIEKDYELIPHEGLFEEYLEMGECGECNSPIDRLIDFKFDY